VGGESRETENCIGATLPGHLTQAPLGGLTAPRRWPAMLPVPLSNLSPGWDAAFPQVWLAPACPKQPPQSHDSDTVGPAPPPLQVTFEISKQEDWQIPIWIIVGSTLGGLLLLTLLVLALWKVRPLLPYPSAETGAAGPRPGTQGSGPCSHCQTPLCVGAGTCPASSHSLPAATAPSPLQQVDWSGPAEAPHAGVVKPFEPNDNYGSPYQEKKIIKQTHTTAPNSNNAKLLPNPPKSSVSEPLIKNPGLKASCYG
jgi:hypothetical protein